MCIYIYIYIHMPRREPSVSIADIYRYTLSLSLLLISLSLSPYIYIYICIWEVSPPTTWHGSCPEEGFRTGVISIQVWAVCELCCHGCVGSAASSHYQLLYDLTWVICSCIFWCSCIWTLVYLLSLSLYIYIYTHIWQRKIERERERERERYVVSNIVSLCS